MQTWQKELVCTSLLILAATAIPPPHPAPSTALQIKALWALIPVWVGLQGQPLPPRTGGASLLPLAVAMSGAPGKWGDSASLALGRKEWGICRQECGKGGEGLLSVLLGCPEGRCDVCVCVCM